MSLQSEIDELNKTKLGIIGKIHIVQHNPDDYPELMKYSFYEMRSIIE